MKGIQREFARRHLPGWGIRLSQSVVRKRRTWAAMGPPLARFQPRSCLELDEHLVLASKIRSIDGHNHLGRWLSADGRWKAPDVGVLIGLMDNANVGAIVNLDGRWGSELEANLDRYDRAHPGRFATFCHVDWNDALNPGFGERLADSLRQSVDRGARGLKVWKDLGLHRQDGEGRLLLPDDPRLDPVWATAAELGVPVVVHTADPVAFYLPVDRFNERVEELRRHPPLSLCDERFPRFQRLMESLESMVARHSATTFIGAHVGCYSENLVWVGRMLDTYPNFFVDIAARVSELGRQPRAARRLIVGHPGRVLFGTDVSPFVPAEYAIYFRFLETEDENFSYSSAPVPGQGRWTVYGISLPNDVLADVYRNNALRMIPGVS